MPRKSNLENLLPAQTKRKLTNLELLTADKTRGPLPLSPEWFKWIHSSKFGTPDDPVKGQPISLEEVRLAKLADQNASLSEES